jgi:cytochrome c biogenesis protein CcmG/thiol:disulfide interchange protein DsbE
VTRRSLAFGGAAVVLGGLLIVTLGWGLQHAALANPPVLGRLAPALAIQSVQGNTVSVDAMRGRPVVLNFWASWCGPCIEEGAVLSNAATSRHDVEFVGADNQDTISGFRTFEQNHPQPYPVGPIIEGSYRSYGVAGLPATFFINADGIVVASFSGPLDTSTLDHYLGLIAS